MIRFAHYQNRKFVAVIFEPCTSHHEPVIALDRQIIADKHKQRAVLRREIGRLFSELFDALVICNVVNDAGFFCKTVFFYKRFAYSLGYTNDFVKLLITAFFFFLIFINAYAPRIVDKIRVNIGNFYAVFIL